MGDCQTPPRTRSERTFQVIRRPAQTGFALQIELSRASGTPFRFQRPSLPCERPMSSKENELRSVGAAPGACRARDFAKYEALPEVPTGFGDAPPTASCHHSRPSRNFAVPRRNRGHRRGLSPRIGLDREIWRCQHGALSPYLRWC